MWPQNAFGLMPAVEKLSRRSPLEIVDKDALLGLPHRTAFKEPGAYLVQEGERAESCIILLSGFAYRSKLGGNGARQILSVHLQGDLVSLHSNLLSLADHSVQALNRVNVAYVPHQSISDLSEVHPAIARALWLDTLIDGSISREWILNLGRRNARQRVSHLLCELALRQQAAGLCQDPDYEWPLTQEQLGDATGLTPVHVNRTIQTMRSDELISTNKRSIKITDWAGLQRVGDFNRAYLH